MVEYERAVDGELYDVYAPAECFVPFFFLIPFFSSLKLKRSSRMSLQWCFLRTVELGVGFEAGKARV